MTDDKVCSFYASLPDIQSAISVGGDGARVKLDVPETDMPAMWQLAQMRGKLLRVSVAEAE